MIPIILTGFKSIKKMIKTVNTGSNVRVSRRYTVTYSTKTKSWNEAFVEETIGEERYGWDRVDYGKNIVELEWAFSGTVVGLQFKTMTTIENHDWLPNKILEIEHFPLCFFHSDRFESKNPAQKYDLFCTFS